MLNCTNRAILLVIIFLQINEPQNLLGVEHWRAVDIIVIIVFFSFFLIYPEETSQWKTVPSNYKCIEI